MRNVTCPESYAALMAQAEMERHWDPIKKRMTSRNNPFNLAHTTFLRMAKEIGLHPYTKKKVFTIQNSLILVRLWNFKHGGS